MHAHLLKPFNLNANASHIFKHVLLGDTDAHPTGIEAGQNAVGDELRERLEQLMALLRDVLSKPTLGDLVDRLDRHNADKAQVDAIHALAEKNSRATGVILGPPNPVRRDQPFEVELLRAATVIDASAPAGREAPTGPPPTPYVKISWPQES